MTPSLQLTRPRLVPMGRTLCSLNLLLLAACGESWTWAARSGPGGTDTAVDPAHDLDGDGYEGAAFGGDDCWDDPASVPSGFAAVNGAVQPAAAEVHPGATETWYDGVDQDCAGNDDFDEDGDGHRSQTHADGSGATGDDCYDAAEDGIPEGTSTCTRTGELAPADVYPGATDAAYDGVDADCSGNDDFDQDGDGYGRCEECDDTNAAIHPNDAPDVWYDGVDANCDGNDGDHDGDGYYVAGYAFPVPPDFEAGDCADDPAAAGTALNAFPDVPADAVNPGAAETWYDGVDADCASDDDFDQDRDGQATSDWPDGAGTRGLDCADTDASIYAGAADPWYDGVDQDCADNDDFDQDGDGFDHGADDCDDTDATVNPTALEDCGTAADDDCSGTTNDVDAVGCTAFSPDVDGDGYGDLDAATCLCTADATHTLSGVTSADADCDEGDATVNPGETEVCNDVDDDCDGSVDVGAFDATSWYADVDGDGRGDALVVEWACARPVGYVADDADCDDTDATISPDGTESCNGVDDDCDGAADDADPAGATGKTTWWPDGDGDGYSWAEFYDYVARQDFCVDPGVGWVDSAGSVDCDDANAAVNPGAIEACDTVDNDCDGAVDEAGATGEVTWYADVDADGYGDPTADQSACDQPPGFVADRSDCDDGDAGVSPGEAEVCDDGVDQDCDGGAPGCGILDGSLVGADVTFTGKSTDDWLYGLAGAGDVDGDGYDDVLLSAYGNDDGGTNAGAVYLEPGEPTPVGKSLAVAPIALTGGTGDSLGYAVAGVGDVDGDGYADFSVGAGQTRGGSPGVVYLVSGGPGLASGTITGVSVVFSGTGSEQAGLALAGEMDADADGTPDIVIGAPYRDAYSGAVYLITGAAGLSDRSLSLADARLTGSGGEMAGNAMSQAGDVNGDGLDDVVVGARWNGSSGLEAGAAYLVLGPITSMPLTSSSATYVGKSAGDTAGHAVAGGGDVDADGYADLLIGAPTNADSGSASGAAYVVLGSSSPVSHSLASADAVFLGAAARDQFGGSVAWAGDVDGDGRDDVVIGAQEYDGAGGTDGGATFLVTGDQALGGATISAAIELTAASSRDYAGARVSGARDFNGDGFADVMIAAPGADATSADVGAVYVMFGGGM